MNKAQLLDALNSMDMKIDTPLTIYICGGAACILSHGLNRLTVDIDVIEASPGLSQFKKEITAVEKEKNLTGDDPWINDGPSKLDTYLPSDYPERCIPLKEKFKNLKVYTLSAGDIVIMKLAVSLNKLTGLRDRDINDVSNLNLNKQDIELIKRTLSQINDYDPNAAETMKNILVRIRPEFSSPVETSQGNNLKVLNEYINKVEKNHKLEISPIIISMWQQDMVAGELSIKQIKIMVEDMILLKGKTSHDNSLGPEL